MLSGVGWIIKSGHWRGYRWWHQTFEKPLWLLAPSGTMRTILYGVRRPSSSPHFLSSSCLQLLFIPQSDMLWSLFTCFCLVCIKKLVDREVWLFCNKCMPVLSARFIPFGFYDRFEESWEMFLLYVGSQLSPYTLLHVLGVVSNRSGWAMACSLPSMFLGVTIAWQTW